MVNKVMIAGATGMIGGLVLKHCLDSERVDEVVVIGRRSTNIVHKKLKEILRTDFLSYEDIRREFTGVQTAFFAWESILELCPKNC